MDIRIAYHPSSDTLMNRISELLRENGISAQFNATPSVANNSDVRITFVKEKETLMATSLLDSSFVHTEQQPGY